MKSIVPINWAKLIDHIESGNGSREQIQLLLSVITKALKDKKELEPEFIEYLNRVSDRYSKNNITLDQSLIAKSKVGRKSNQPAELGGLPITIYLVYKEMINGYGRDSAISFVASENNISASKIRDDIKFYKQDFINGLLLEKKLLKTKFTPTEVQVIKKLLDPSFSTENV